MPAVDDNPFHGGDVLRKLRGKESKTAFAWRAGMTRQTLAKMEENPAKALPETVRKVATALGLSEIDLREKLGIERTFDTKSVIAAQKIAEVTSQRAADEVEPSRQSSLAVNPDEEVRRVTAMFRSGWQQHVALEVMHLSDAEAEDAFHYIVNLRRGLSPRTTNNKGST